MGFLAWPADSVAARAGATKVYQDWGIIDLPRGNRRSQCENGVNGHETIARRTASGLRPDLRGLRRRKARQRRTQYGGDRSRVAQDRRHNVDFNKGIRPHARYSVEEWLLYVTTEMTGRFRSSIQDPEDRGHDPDRADESHMFTHFEGRQNAEIYGESGTGDGYRLLDRRTQALAITRSPANTAGISMSVTTRHVLH